MKPPKILRLGIVGAGGITQSRHLPGLKKLRHLRLVAVCNRSCASSQAVAKQWGFERIARTPMEIIRAKDIDAVLIGTWPYLHHSLSCAALKAGKHVFTQARMARNLAEAKRMLAEARRHPHLVSMICPSPFGMKGTLFVHKLLREGYVGNIRLVQFRSLTSAVADPTSPISWRQQKRLNGLNTLSFGIHMERFLQWLGPVVSVQATSSIFTPLRKDVHKRQMRVTVPDQLQVLALLKDHQGVMNLSFSGAVRHPEDDLLRIYGDRGTLEINFRTDEIRGARANEKKLRSLRIPRNLIRSWNVESDFIDSIRAGGRHRLPAHRRIFLPPDFQEGVRYMAVTEATLQAARTGHRIRVEY